eukprot:403344515
MRQTSSASSHQSNPDIETSNSQQQQLPQQHQQTREREQLQSTPAQYIPISAAADGKHQFICSKWEKRHEQRLNSQFAVQAVAQIAYYVNQDQSQTWFEGQTTQIREQYQEFESLRQDNSHALQNQELSLLKRIEHVEIKQNKMLQDQTQESINGKQKMDLQYSHMLNMEQEIKRELERQKMMQNSMMTDQRLSSQQFTEDINSILKQLHNLQQNSRNSNEIVESLGNQQNLTYRRLDDLENNLTKFIEVQTDTNFGLDTKLDGAVRDLENLRSSVIPLQEGMMHEMRQRMNSLEVNTSQSIESLEMSFQTITSNFQSTVSHLERLSKESPIQTLRDLDRKNMDLQTQLQQLNDKSYLQEQIIYDFRRDLAQNMNEIERFFNKKNEQVARAFTELSKELRINKMQAKSSVLRRYFSGAVRVVNQKVSNTNVTPHNPESRQGMTAEEFGFAKTFNMGYEGFSKPLPLPRSNPIYQTRQEIFYIIALFTAISFMASARKGNEEALRSQIKTTNRYAELQIVPEYRNLSQWKD